MNEYEKISNEYSSRIRGILGSSGLLVGQFGIVLAIIFGTFFSFKMPSIFMIAVIILFVVSFYSFPETPQFLVKQNDFSVCVNKWIVLWNNEFECLITGRWEIDTILSKYRRERPWTSSIWNGKNQRFSWQSQALWRTFDEIVWFYDKTRQNSYDYRHCDSLFNSCERLFCFVKLCCSLLQSSWIKLVTKYVYDYCCVYTILRCNSYDISRGSSGTQGKISRQKGIRSQLKKLNFIFFKFNVSDFIHHFNNWRNFWLHSSWCIFFGGLLAVWC